MTPAQVSAEIATIIGTLEGVLPALLSQGVASHTVDDIQLGLDDARAAVDALVTADAGGQAQDLIDRIGADLSAVLTALAAVSLPAEAVLPVRIAGFLVPVMISVADMIWPPKVQPAMRA